MGNKLKTYGLNKMQLLGLGMFFLIGLFGDLVTQESSVGKEGFLIPYSASTIDKDNRNVSPFDPQKVSDLKNRHWLGTDPIGRDVFAGLISGTNVAMKVGFLTMSLSILVGVLFGFLSGFIGDKGFRLGKIDFGLCIFSLFICFFYVVYGTGALRLGALFLMFCTIVYAIMRADKNTSNGIAIPFDLIIMRILEIFKSIPGLFLILVLLTTIRKPSIWSVVIVIVIVSWPRITRYLRAEILKIKEQDFIMADRALGLPEWRIFKNSVLPLAIAPVLIIGAFSFASAILLESTLSFLGIGVPPDVATWGSLLSMARENFSSWWLAFFPGLMIYLVILLFNSVGDSLNEYLRGRGRV